MTSQAERIACVEKNRNARLDNPGLFRRDLFDRISQDICVVQAYGRDHRKRGMLDIIGGIQLPPMPVSRMIYSTSVLANAVIPMPRRNSK